MVGPWNFPTQMFAVRLAREFLDHEKGSAHNLSINRLLSNSHGPSMYILSIAKEKKKSWMIKSLNPSTLIH